MVNSRDAGRGVARGRRDLKLMPGLVSVLTCRAAAVRVSVSVDLPRCSCCTGVCRWNDAFKHMAALLAVYSGVGRFWGISTASPVIGACAGEDVWP